MGVQFPEHKIADGFIKILHDIYFYTARWGFSVRHFTGKDQKYWQALPKRLGKAKDSPKELNRIIRELEKLEAESEERRKRHRVLVKGGGFNKKEVVINEQLLAILAALPHQLLSATFRCLTSEDVLPRESNLVETKLVSGEVEPDFLIVGGRQLLMGELKVKADRISRDTQYDANQLYNYLSLAIMCYAENGPNLPNRFSHVILLPSIDFRWFVQGQQWIKQLQVGLDRHMQLDVKETDEFAKKKKKNQRYIKNFEELDKWLARIPVYCRSYDDLVNSFEKVIAGYPLESHWRRISRELRELAEIASAGL